MVLLRRASLLLALLMLMAAFTVQAQDNPPNQPTSPIDDIEIPMPNSPPELDDSLIPMPNATADTELDESLIPMPTQQVTADDSDLIPLPKMTATAAPQPKMDIPAAGVWAYRYRPGQVSGDCSKAGGFAKGDGTGADYDPNDPINQTYVCTWNPKAVVMVGADTFRGTKVVQPATYMTAAETSSSDAFTTQRTLTVVDKQHFTVRVQSTAGTCKVEMVIEYTLVKPGTAWGCSTSLPPQEPVEQNPSQPQLTPAPTEIEDTVIDPPTVIEGDYTVTWLPFQAPCTASNSPKFDTVTLGKSSEEDIVLIVDGKRFNLFGDRLSGQYLLFDGNVSITLERRFADDFNLEWQTMNQLDSCFAKGLLSLRQPLTADARASLSLPMPLDPDPIILTPPQPAAPPIEAALSTPAPGQYRVTWETMAGTCNGDPGKLLPNFTQAKLTQKPDGTYVLETDQGTYPLVTGMMYMKTDAKGGSVMALTEVGGRLTGTFSAYTSTGQSCAANLTFDAK
jgi:hypothetical protein